MDVELNLANEPYYGLKYSGERHNKEERHEREYRMKKECERMGENNVSEEEH